MNTKGLTTVALNWIFVLIAGGVILLFFFNILLVQTKISEGEVAGRVLRDLQAVLVGKSVSEGSDSLIRMPKKSVEFFCEEPCTPETGCISGFGIKGGEFQFDSATQVLFSSSEIDSDFVYSFARAWNVPFRVTNFLYLVDSSQKVVFLESDTNPCSSSSFCGRIYESVPSRIREVGVVVKGDAAVDVSGNTKKITYVQFQNCPMVSGISVTAGVQNFLCIDDSKVYFYEDGLRLELAYFQDESLLGAIFSENSLTYQCNMKKAFYRLNSVAESISGKMDILKELYKGTSFPTDVCYDQLLNAETSNLIGPYSYSYIDTLDSSSILELEMSSQKLVELNSRMQGRSCATLY